MAELLNEEAAEVSIVQASICASTNDVGVAGGSGSGSGHGVPSHGAGDLAKVESATSVDDSIAGSGSGLAPLAHDDLQGVVRLLSGCSAAGLLLEGVPEGVPEGVAVGSSWLSRLAERVAVVRLPWPSRLAGGSARTGCRCWSQGRQDSQLYWEC